MRFFRCRLFGPRQMHTVIHMGHFEGTGDHIAVPHKDSTVHIPLKSADLFQIQQIQRGFRDGIDIFVQLIVNHELSKLPVSTHIGGNHNAVQPVGHIDEVGHGNRFVSKAFLLAQVLENAIHNGAPSILHGIQPAGKKVQLVQGRAVQPEACEFWQSLAMLDADVPDAVCLRISVCPFLGFRDFFCAGRQ